MTNLLGLRDFETTCPAVTQFIINKLNSHTYLLFYLRQREPDEPGVTQREQDAFPTGNLATFARKHKQEQQYVDGEENQKLIVHHLIERQRGDERADAQDDEDVQDIGTHHIADGDGGILLESRHDGGDEFGQ